MRPPHLAVALVISLTSIGLHASAQDAPSPAEERRRREALTAGGGDARTEAAVDEALRWLAAHQLEDGRWDPAGWTGRCWKDGPCARGDREQGNRTFTEGVTGLALLAFYNRGFTTASPLHGQVITKGLTWLRSRQGADGSIGFDASCGETIYNHALATAVLAHAAPSLPAVRPELEAAVRFCMEAENPGLGWKYGVRSGRNDSSVTAWMGYALVVAQRAGVEVPESAFSGALSWFSRATDSEGNVGYETPGGGSSYFASVDGQYDLGELPTLTAASVAVQRLIGQHEQGMASGASVIAAHPPAVEPRRLNFYYWFWGAHALRQVGGKGWSTWNTALKAAVLPRQRTDGCASGSWDPVDPWSSAGGRVYATAILALALEAYYQPVAPPQDFSAKGVAARAAAREAQAAALAALPAQVAAIGAGGREAERAVTALAKAVNHDTPAVRDAARAQVALDGATTTALLELLRGGGRTAVRRDALRLLATLSARGEPVLAAIVAALTDVEQSIRVAAANALGEWGRAAASAVEALERAKKDPEQLVKNAAERALARVRGG